MNVGTDSTILTKHALNGLLSAIGYGSAEELMSELRLYRRGEIPSGIQSRLGKAFKVDMGFLESDPEFLFRKIELDINGALTSLPFPIKAICAPSFKLSIAGFRIDSVKGENYKVSVRLGVATNEFLGPTRPTDRMFCDSFLIGDADLRDDLNQANKRVLVTWLAEGGLDNLAARRAAEDDETRWNLFNQVWDRIEEIISVGGSLGIKDVDGHGFALEGEEEKGFSNGRHLGAEFTDTPDKSDQHNAITEISSMKATLMIEGKKKISIELGYDDLSSIVSNFPDTSENADTYAALAEHPSVAVRESVAGKDKIDEATVNLLAGDSDVSVIRALVRSDKARECLTTEQLIGIIDRDVDAAESIAGYVESYESAASDDIAEALAKHTDPRVRAALASNSSAPKKLLKNLLKDSDSRVRASAKQSLD